jgi:ABC-type multidrug transport system fused ATPase/permease subunit
VGWPKYSSGTLRSSSSTNPTPALDAPAENNLYERSRTLLTARTVLLISHRFSGGRLADRIYVLWTVTWCRPAHEEVIERGLNAELVTLQATADLQKSSRGTVSPYS